MKLRLIPLGLALSAATLAHAQFAPVPIDPASFNHDVIIEASAPAPLNSVVTATMDGGTNKNGNTWYERGYNTARTDTGLPVAGSLVTSGTHTFQMPPDYHTNNVIMVGHNNGNRTPILGPGTLTLTTPAAFTALSFLTTSASGGVAAPVRVGYTIHYADSFAESGTFVSPDWFSNTPAFYNTAGRVTMAGGVANVGGNPAGELFFADVALINPSVNVTSVDLYFAGAAANGNTNNNGRAVIFAISGAKDYSSDFTNTLAVTGFTYDAVVEADGPQSGGPLADGYLTNYCTATMDGGTSKAANCWYEKGYYAAFPNTGFPAPGATLTSATIPATYTMPASYAANNAVILASNITSANITLATPAAYGALSFLCSAANSDTILPCVVQFQDGSSETNALFVPDWSTRTVPWAYLAFGRVWPTFRALNTTPDQQLDPFSLGVPGYDFRGLGIPWGRLFDGVINLTNTTSAVTNISFTFTNNTATALSTRVTGIYAVSGAPADKVPPVFGARGTAVPGQPANAVVNNITQVKAWEGTNNIVLSVTNIAGTSPIAYQWKKAPRGGGLHDMFYSIDYNTFADVTDGGRISGATSSALVISNALVADSADYLVVASSAGGSVTSLVATVMLLTTNQNLLVGAPAGDVIARYTPDGSPTAEAIEHVIDQVAQKWLSYSLMNNVLPFVGPVGYVVTPVSGASIASSMRFFTANDSSGRDPYDYALEGSNDGANWTLITGGALKGTLALPTTRNGTGSAALSPLTNAVVEVDFANSTGYKSYRVTITNNYNLRGDALMQIAEIQVLGTLVPNPPVFTRQPHSVTVFAGASPVFSVDASGYPPPRYQWLRNGSPITGATNAIYTLANAQTSDSGTTFACNAINTFGTVPSTTVTLTVIAAPTQPYAVAVLANNPVGYWRLGEGPDNGLGNNGVIARDSYGGHDGTYSNVVLAVQGYNPTGDPDTAADFGTFATQNSYVDGIDGVSFARPAGAGGATFSVEAWVYGGVQTVDAAIVSKGYNGILTAGTGTGTEQFVLDVLTAGNSRKFRFLVRDAAGNGRFAQSTVAPFIGDLLNPIPTWRHLVGVCDQPNGKLYLYVDGLLAASGDIGSGVGILDQPLPMTIGARKSGGATAYDNQWAGRIDDVAVYSSALSASQVLSHYFGAQYPPAVTLNPTNTTTPENVSVTFYSAAYGSGTLGYQWYLSDSISPTTPLAGQTSSNLTFTTTAAQNFNYYQVVVTNEYGSATSAVAQLTVVSGVPSFIVDLPTSQSVLLGHVIQMRVEPGGTAPFTYQWKKDGVDLVDDYRTSGAQTNVLIVGYATNSDNGNYQVVVSNGQGSTPSFQNALTVISAASSAVPFNAAGTGWTMQGTTMPIMGDNRLELSSGLGSTDRSAFMNAQQPVASFNASFVYQLTSGAGGADGITFCVQNDPRGATAVGGAGGALGYSGITPSVALALNIYANNTRGIQFLQNGTLPAAGAGAYFAIDPVLVGGNANPIQVKLAYSAGTASASFRDTVTSATYTTNIALNVPAVIGSSLAYFGFTGADGGVVSTQVITDFNMNPPPVSLTVQKVGDSMVLSWPASTGAFLRSTPSLTNPVWTYSTALFRVVDGRAQVTVTPLTGTEFYRLDVYP